jgi:hypothetical protein
MPFNPKNMLANLPAPRIEAYLRAIGDDGTADRLFPPGGSGQNFGLKFGGEVWGHTGVALGFIPPTGSGETAILDATAMVPEPGLKNAQVKIVLDQFWVQRYPGSGKHKILCEFTGKNQTTTVREDLRFALKLEARDQSPAGVNGAPIFLGVSAGKNGISFEGRMIHVGSSGEDAMLAALESDAVKQGLSLLTTAQPALGPFVGLAGSLVAGVLKRDRNKEIYNFKLGLDFADSQTSAKLRFGSFVVVQTDMATWSWSRASWDRSRQLVIDTETNEPIAYNYLIFRISPYDD